MTRGEFNHFGFDADIPAVMKQNSDRKWELEIMDGWPWSIKLNIFQYYFYGDTDSDSVLDRLLPNSLAVNFVNMTTPPKPHLGWTLIVDDVIMSWSLQPRGYLSVSTILYGLLSIPFITTLIATYIFMRSHYGIKYNQFGVISKGYTAGTGDQPKSEYAGNMSRLG